MLRLAGEGVVFNGAAENERSALYPGVCVMPSGRVIVTFRLAPRREATTGQRVMMRASDDGGKTFYTTAVFEEMPAVEGRYGESFLMYVTPLGGNEALGAVQWVDCSRPERPYYNPETSGIIDHRVFFTRTADNGESWQPVWQMEGPAHPRPTALTSPVVALPDGRLMCQFEVHKNHDEQGPVFFEGAVVFSQDGGRSFDGYTRVSHDPAGRIFYWDQRLNTAGSGLLGLFWTYDDKASKYLNIHAARSADGRAWGPHFDTGVPGQPSQPVRLAGGTLAMAFADRTGAPAIKVRQSFDDGATWPDETEVVLFDSGQARQDNSKTSLNDMWSEMYRFSVGFPVAAALPDGGLMVCYYAGPSTDETVIRWARLSAG